MNVIEQFEYEEVLGLKFGSARFGSPKMFLHIYFIDGLLIDTGHSKMKKEIIATTQNLPIEQIFITHHHEDHSGNIPEFRQLFDCDVYASPLCCEMMKSPPEISFLQKLTLGARPPVVDLLPKEALVKTKQYQFQIIPILGHACDMVALYEPERKWLFSADLYVNTHIRYFLDSERVLPQIASIKKILRLDFEAVLCSHNPTFENGKEQLSQKLIFLETFYNEVSLLYQKSYTIREIFKSLNLKESWAVRFLSTGKISKLNMVKAVIRDLEIEKKIRNESIH